MASAAAPETPTNKVYFPFVPNGYSMNGEGPFTGSVTIQNLENARVTVSLTNNQSGSSVQTFDLNPHASKTFSPSQLSIASGSVAGVVATAAFSNQGSNVCANPTTTVATLTHAANNGADRITLPSASVTPVSVVRVYAGDGGTASPPAGTTIYQPGSDYIATTTAPTSSTNPGSILIDFSPSGAEPGVGATYTVVYQTCPTTTTTARAPRIAGVEKHHAPGASGGNAGNAAKTSSADTVVDGYTGLSSLDLLAGSVNSYIIPIVQNGWNGWNSTIFVTNLSGRDNVGATITFYTAYGQGAAGGSVGSFTNTLAKGQTWAIDSTTLGLPSPWVGSAWVSVDDPGVVTAVARNKAVTSMSLTNTGEAFQSQFSQTCFQVNHQCRYSPLVFKDYNGWNTGINVANLSNTQNTVTVTYYNQAGNEISQDQITIPYRGMEYIYRPQMTPVNGNQDNNINAATSIASATVVSDGPISAATDEVKYVGGPGQGQAMSYLNPAYGAAAGESLALPLVQKGNATTGIGDTSGVNMFNFGGQTQAAVWFFDQSGATVAPTLTQPVDVLLPPFASATLYSLNYQEMPEGFQGSAVVENLGATGNGVAGTAGGQGGAGSGSGTLAAVSNNVNYGVAGDGSAVYNLARVQGLVQIGAAAINCTPTGATNVAGEAHTITCTVTDVAGNPVANVPVLFNVTGANGTVGIVYTNPSGVATFTYTGTVAGRDTITATALDASLMATSVTTSVRKTYIAGPAALVNCAPTVAYNPPGTTHTVYCLVTDAYGNPVATNVVTVVVSGRNSVGPYPVTSTASTQTTTIAGVTVVYNATFSYTDAGPRAGSTPPNDQDKIDFWIGQPSPSGTPAETVYKIWNTKFAAGAGMLTAAPATVAYGGTSNLTFKFTNNGQPVAGLNVTFGPCTGTTLNGALSTTTGVTDANGQLTTTFTAGTTTGTSQICAFNTATGELLATGNTITVVNPAVATSGTVNASPTTSTCTTSTANPPVTTCTSSTLTASFTNGAGGAVSAGQTVTFNITGPGTATSTLTGTTNSSGTASAKFTPNATGTYTITATLGSFTTPGSATVTAA